MNRFRTLNGCPVSKDEIKLQDIASSFVFPDNDETKMLKLIYADGNDLALYLNKNTRPEIRQAIENLLVAHDSGTKYPDDVIAFEMLPKENESRSAYGRRLQSIINDEYNNSLNTNEQ